MTCLAFWTTRFFPEGARVCQLDSTDLGADFDDAAEAILVLHRHSIKPFDHCCPRFTIDSVLLSNLSLESNMVPKYLYVSTILTFSP